MLFTLQRYEFFSKSQQAEEEDMWEEDVVYPTKVRIFQQITTVSCDPNLAILMLFTLQRYEFFSKSQQAEEEDMWEEDVVYPTKVRIFQQITTVSCDPNLAILMLFTLQRYEFFSKSQQG